MPGLTLRAGERYVEAELDSLPTEERQHNRLCELNVVEQVVNVSQTTVVRDAWARDQSLSVHGWIYDLHDGLLRDLGVSVTATPVEGNPKFSENSQWQK